MFFLIYMCFYFKHKTAYEMRIIDWSSDVCSSDLRDVASLVLHQHDQAGNDVERGHHDDQGENQEHDVALHLERVDEGRVGLLPVVDPHPWFHHLLDGMTDLTGVVRMADGDLQVADRLGKLEEELRRRHRHEDETVVVLEHADLEEAGDAVAAQIGRAHV